MSYIGNTATQQEFTPAIDYFSGNGSTVAFTLSRPVASVAQVQVVVNNVPQNPGTAFTVLNSTITFTGAPSSGTNNVYVQYTSPITQVIQPGQGTVTSDSFGVITNFTTTGNTVLGDASTDTLNVGNGGLVKDASGNVGIGVAPTVPSAGTVLEMVNGATLYARSSASVPQLYISSNAVGTGYAPTYKVNGYATQYVMQGYDGTHSWYGAASGTAGNAITWLSRMTLDTIGNLLVGTTNSSSSAGPGIKLQPSTTTPAVSTVFDISAGNYNTYLVYNVNATYNGYRFYVATNGGVINYSGNNANLSDERTKTNIELSGNYLDKICAIPVKLFNYKDEAEGEQRTLGVIAQDVELVAPELVNLDGFGETPEDGVPLKSIYTTDMQFALMKCIQEQQALITTLTERITALEAK